MAVVAVGGEGTRGLGCRLVLLEAILAPQAPLELLQPALVMGLGSVRVQELVIHILHANMLSHKAPVNPWRQPARLYMVSYCFLWSFDCLL